MLSKSHPVRQLAVIVGCDLVGDALMKLPFLRALRAAYPDARIDWLTSRGPSVYAGILRDIATGLIDRVIETPVFLPTARKHTADFSQAPFYDLIIDTRAYFRDVFHAWLIPHRVYISNTSWFVFSDRRPFAIWHRPEHVVDGLLQLVRLASGRQPAPEQKKLTLAPALVAAAQKLLPPGRRYIGFAPGAGNREKVWPLANYISVAARQAADGLAPVFLLGPDETAWQADIKPHLPQALFPLQDRAAWGSPSMRIDETIAIGSRLTLAVANDSGTSHMLAAADCPLISLFGPTNPAKLAPRLKHQRVLKAQDFDGTQDMRAIPETALHGAIDSLLGELPRLA